MRKGKIAAQAAHASLSAVLKYGHVTHYYPLWAKILKLFGVDTRPRFEIPLDDDLEAWLTGRFKKITLYVESELELEKLFHKAKEAGLRTVLITDSGLTEFNGVPTRTCFAIGPHTPDKIDPITGHLKPL